MNDGYAVVPDIQESDHGAAPSLEWFRDTGRIRAVVQAEMDVMREYRPDRVLGVFRFTAKAAAAVLGIPFDSLICGCMMPDNPETLGFRTAEAGAESQQRYLDNFFRFAGRKISAAIAPFECEPITDARTMLTGERTYLWDFPEFMPLSNRMGRYHVGPLQWDNWPDMSAVSRPRVNDRRPKALITFGTCCTDRRVVQKLIGCLLDQGYTVLIAAGNQPEMVRMGGDSNRVQVWPFAPLNTLLPLVELVVSHGGQMTLFESLQHGVPVFVMPFQPEQAHNGVCLERIGCGRRLTPAVAYKGDPAVYIDGLMQRTQREISAVIETVMQDPDTSVQLKRTRRMLKKYAGASRLAAMMIK